MKVAIVLNTSWNIYNFRLGLVKALLENGFEVVAIAPKDPYSEKLVDMGCSFRDLTMDSKGLNPYKDLRLIMELKSIYKQERPDIVLHFTIKPNIYGSIAASSLGIPIINNVSGLGTVFLWNRPIKLLATMLYNFSFSRANFIFFQNKDDKQLFGKWVKLEAKKVGLLPGSGINTRAFTASEHKQSKNFVFLMIARLIIDKGVYEYVEAAKALKTAGIKAQFQLLGATDFTHKRGIPEKDVLAWSKEGYIEYLGATEDVKETIKHADCVVLPSYREGTPRTLLEGGAMKKPLIATDVPGCNSIVENGINGLLCEVKNPEDLASKMKEMFEMPEKNYLQMAEQSRKIVEEKFDEQIVIDLYLNKINQLI